MAPRASTAAERTCIDCKLTKPVADFHGKGSAKDGTPKYQSYCRKCANIRRTARGRNPEVARRASRKHQTANSELIAQRQAARRANDITIKFAESDRHLWRKYGITRQEWGQRIIDQEYRCAICRMELDLASSTRSNTSVKTCVDHDHDTGMVRGILCDFCNKGLGMFHDDVGLLESAIKYLTQERPPP